MNVAARNHLKSVFPTQLIHSERISLRRARTGNNRLLKLAKYLYDLPESKFDLLEWISKRSCGTVACAIGWCPVVFPKHWKANGSLPELRRHSHNSCEDASDFFNLNDREVDGLFIEGWAYHDIANKKPTPRDVAEAIRFFVRSRPTK